MNCCKTLAKHFALLVVAVCLSANARAADPALSKSDADLANSLVGSWRIVDAHRDGVPSKLHFSCVTIKHITPTQFVWLSYKPEDRKIFRSMGGSWKVVDGAYVETPQYSTGDGFVDKQYGTTATIEAKIEGDLFTQTMSGKDGSTFIEVWQRMKPGEDWSALPVSK